MGRRTDLRATPPDPAPLAEEIVDLVPLLVADAYRPIASPRASTLRTHPARGDRLVAFLGRDTT